MYSIGELSRLTGVKITTIRYCKKSSNASPRFPILGGSVPAM